MTLSSPQIYVVRRIKDEVDEASNHYYNTMKPNFTSERWMNLPEEERESLYKITIPISVISALMRRSKWFLDIPNTGIKILRNIKQEDDIGQIIFTQGENEKIRGYDFGNMVRDQITIKSVCDYFIHMTESSFPYAEECGKIKHLDNLPMIYLAVTTDQKPKVFVNIEDFLNKINNRVTSLL